MNTAQMFLFGQDDGMSLRGVIDFWLKLILNQVSHQKFHEIWSLAINRSTATYLPFKTWLSIGMLQDYPEICQEISSFPQTSPDTCEQNPHVLSTSKHSGLMNVHPFFLGEGVARHHLQVPEMEGFINPNIHSSVLAVLPRSSLAMMDFTFTKCIVSTGNLRKGNFAYH